MKKRMKRCCTLLMCMLLMAGVGSEAYAGSMDSGFSQSDETAVEEDTDSADETEAAEEEETSSQDETQEAQASSQETDEDAQSQESEEDSAADPLTTSDDEAYVVSTSCTYSLSITTTSSPVSSSNSILKTLKVSKPKLTTTTTTTWSDGTVTTSSETQTYDLTVRVHVNNVGFETASLGSDGYYTYTASKAASGNYMQAVQIIPSDALKSAMKTAGLTFYYVATVQYFGRLGWAPYGDYAGSTGNGTAMTNFEIGVVRQSVASTVNTEDHYISATSVAYTTKTTGASSWNAKKLNGSCSGTSTATIGMLAAKIQRANSSYGYSGTVKYSVRTTESDSSSNWSSWYSDYTGAGSSGSALRCIKMSLTGEMAQKYDIYYRVYIGGLGWLGWAKNGEKAGLTYSSLKINAVEIQIVPKGADAPGDTTDRFVSGNDTKMKLLAKAQSISSSTGYLILVDRSACKVAVFSGAKNNWRLKYYWSCCVGKASTPTISGSYTTTGYKAYSFGESKGYSCYYATQIKGNYLFHSVLYYPYTNTIKDGTMGKAVSHGCIRLTKTNAKWIYDNIKKGTKVYIY